jgi:hypothetical protein
VSAQKFEGVVVTSPTLPAEVERLVKSRQRVADHGEVFTPAWMVEAMLDLVKEESERIDSRVLEPAFMRNLDVSRDTRNLRAYWAIAS